MKKFYKLLFICLLILSGGMALKAQTTVDSGKCGNNLTWTLDSNGKLTISGTGAMYDYTSSSEAPWRKHSSSLKSLTLEEGMTSIGDYAFIYCSGFTGYLTIPNSVTTIGEDAFYYCYGFKGSLTIPNSVTTIKDYAFWGCSGFTGSLTIPNSVTTIGDKAFYKCSGFTGSLTITNSVTTIGTSAFYGCSGFKEVYSFPENAPELGDKAFEGMNSQIILHYLKSSEDSYNSNGWFGYFSNVKAYETDDDGFLRIKTIEDLIDYVYITNVIGHKFSVRLHADINLTGVEWTPFSTERDVVFDGNGHNIHIEQDWSSTTSDSNFGLFHTYNYNVIKDLTMTGYVKANTSGNVGAITGSAYRTTISNVISYVEVTNIGSGRAGGLAGQFGGQHSGELYSLIENCAVYADVTGNVAGGIIGHGWSGNQYYDIKNVAYVGDVTGSERQAAVIAYHGNNSSATKCKFENIYYCEKDALGFVGGGGNNYDLGTDVAAMTAAQFASGEVAYLLQGEQATQIWGQNIDNGETVQQYPVFSDAKVHLISCGDVNIYSNTYVEHSFNENGFCNTCGNCEPAVFEDNYYSISNAGNLVWFSKHVNNDNFSANAKLMNDIEMNAVQWTPIGTSDAYNGTFDGQGHTINNLWHNTGVADGGREGLFTLIGSNGVVTNVTLNNATIWGSSPYGLNGTGGIAVRNEGCITNTMVTNSSIQQGAYEYLGGIAGWNKGSITNCAVINSTLTRRWGGANSGTMGGITQTNSGSVTNCYTYGCMFNNGNDLNSAIVAKGTAPVNSYYYTTDNVADAAETARTKEQFASGEVAYLLQGEQTTQVWGQNIDNGEAVQQYPVFSDAKVYKYTFGDFVLYSNHKTYGKCGDNLYWYVDENNTLTIFGTGTMYDYEYNGDNISPWRKLETAPTSLVLEDGITHIGNYAFRDCKGLSGSLTIPNSVTTIGNYAFCNCSGFTGSLTIPNNVTTIGNHAFYCCEGFTGDLTIPNSITTIGNFAFNSCSGFTGSLTIPNSVTSIGNYAFGSCKFSGTLTIPNSVTSIGNGAFYKCKGFTGSLTIPNSVTSIGEWAFFECSGFTGSLTIPNSVTSIEECTFYGCSGFTGSLTIPNSVTYIGNEAFKQCNGFSDVCSLAETAPTLGKNAFSDINSNAILYYPTSGEQSYNDKGWFDYFSNRIGFGKCGDNLYWYVDDNNTLTIFGTGAMYDYNDSNNKAPWRNLKTVPTSLVLEEGITHIGNFAFCNCKGLSGSLTIPNSVTTIGNFAFYDCYGFTGSLTIPNSVTTIGNWAFGNCSGFKGSLTIPNSVTSIGEAAFFGCSGFTGSLTIPNSVTTIGNYAFENCSGFNGFLTIPNSVTSIGKEAFYKCSGFTGSLTIPNSVTSIGNWAFGNCSGFKGSLAIGNSVTTIGDNAFRQCNGFSDVYSFAVTAPTLGTDAFDKPNNATLYYPASSEQSYDDNGWFEYFPQHIGFNNKCGDNLYWIVNDNTLTIFGTGAMDDYESSGDNISPWRKLETAPTSLLLEEGITHIGNNAFAYCSGLTGSLTIPNSVTTIGNEAFYYCFGFTGDLTIPNSVTTIEEWAFGNCSGFTGDLTIPNSVTTIGNYAFYYCFGFTGDLTIPNSVTSIGNYAFIGCSGFTGDLTIPNSVTTIGDSAFAYCSGFNGELTIPNSVTSIGNWVFASCEGFNGELTIPNSVTTIGNYAFYNCSGFNGDLTIPNSVTSIGNSAFYYCYGLTNIFFYRDTNPTIYSYTFSNLNSNAKIYAPVIWESFTGIPSDKLVKMATFVGQQTTDNGQQSSSTGWVGLAEGQTEPNENDHVAVNAPLVLGSLQDYKTTRLQGSEANSLSVKSFGYCGNGTTVNGSITIEDGGELYCEIARGEVTVKKDIIGYAETTRLQDNETTSETVWYTIASPLKDTLLISDSQFLNSSVPQFLSSNSDLYRYDEPTYTWQNAKPGEGSTNFQTIDPGRGYLYANAENTTLEFTGMINTDEVTYSLTTDGIILKGFHLVGNPFTHNITFAHLNATEGAELVNGYYVLNGEGAWGATLGSNDDDVIKPVQGVLVKAKSAGTLAIAKTQRRRDAESQSRGQQDNRTTRQQVLEMSVSNAQHSDRAFVVFDKGVGLDKINHENENIPLLYIPMDDTDYAIAMMDMNVNEIPVSFETKVMGQYTISLRQENCEFDELYLLDKQTGEKVNILENDYTFIATSNDAPERFVLLKDNGQQSTDNSHFAYVNNGDIVIYDINGNADIKIFDAMGRCLYMGNSSDETARIANDFSAGVYVIQKADDNGVNVQKIIL